jgi:murein DD-endopeptidase MepM/ murein hydrolase activator NlpD
VVKDELVRRINANDGAGVFEMFAPSMRVAFPVDVTTQFVGGVASSGGKIIELSPLASSPHSGVYAARAEKTEWRFTLHIDEVGGITGLTINTAPPPDPPVATSKVPLSLPLKGPWLVAWGGETAERNTHVTHPVQRRAADLVVASAGKDFKTDGKKNDDYLAYGREVLAAADGTVVTVIDGVPENVPGDLNPDFVYGNVIVVEHGPQLFGVYAHLVPGKLRAKPGAKVKRGAVLGLVGNSGNSSEPHLHLQLQDAPSLEHAWGVEPVFANVSVTRDGKTEKVPSYTFQKGDVIETADAK